MKIKVSISIEDKTMKDVEDTVKDSIFRNKSHFIELATQRYLKEAKGAKWKL